jgi:hypothetical protein
MVYLIRGANRVALDRRGGNIPFTRAAQELLCVWVTESLLTAVGAEADCLKSEREGADLGCFRRSDFRSLL